MQRRTFLKASVSAALLAATRGGNLLAQTGSAPKIFWVQLFANGGWDQMLFCDPKKGIRSSQNGAHHSDSQIKTAGNLSYVDAYAANNQALAPVGTFFDKFYSRLLVMNGLDATTNNHDVGARYFMSGSLLEGFPIFAAQVAGSLGATGVMPMVDVSGYDETAGLVAPVRLDYLGMNQISRLTNTNESRGEYSNPHGWFTSTRSNLLDTSALGKLRAAREARLQRQALLRKLPNHQRAVAAWQAALQATTRLSEVPFPASDDDDFEMFKRLTTMGIQSFKAGLATSMTVSSGGQAALDSHGQPDTDHLAGLQTVFRLAEHISDTADAEHVPCVVVMSSDFGRTPVREGNGSGHWPISSMMVLQNQQMTTEFPTLLPRNKTIGLTTGEALSNNNLQSVLRAVKINRRTHAPDDTGIALSPAHVWKALRRVAGVHDHPTLRPFPINVEGGELEWS